MIRETDPSIADDSQVEALLAFDDALAAGADPSTSDWPASPLDAVHECQRLLEAVWPRSVPDVDRSPGAVRTIHDRPRGGPRRLRGRLPGGGSGLAAAGRAQGAAARGHGRGVDPAAVPPRGGSRLPPRPPAHRAGVRGGGRRADLLHRLGLLRRADAGRVAAPADDPGSLDEAARLVAVLAAAVAHAHQRGILHRDLKPGNILLQPREEPPLGSDGKAATDLASYVPRICDFGLAKLLDEVSQETCSGLAIGSPPYMAPEQAAGRTREQGPATDVYALGVILYELLTGRPPLRGETDLETLRLVADQDPPSPRALRPACRATSETICLKCLEKRPERRYAGAAELAADLGRFLEGRPIRARRSSAWETRLEVGPAPAGPRGAGRRGRDGRARRPRRPGVGPAPGAPA